MINFLAAIALVFIFEGIFPFLSPDRWKRLLQKVIQQDDKVLRIFGFVSMLVGVILLTLMHQFSE